MNRFCLMLAFLVAFPILGNAQRKRAFLVGISTYRTQGYKVWNNIHGAEDIALLTPELKKKGFKDSNIVTILNEQATCQNILSSLDAFIKATHEKDVVYLHFSCHGQPVEDGLNGNPKDEKDGWDEALVPIDAGKEYGVNSYQGDNHITDDQLKEYLTRLRKKMGPKGMLYVAIDACHAGTISRKGFETVRGTNEGLTKTGTKYNPPMTNVRHYVITKAPDLAPTMFIEACQSRERNTEVRIDGKEYGALSYNIFQALRGMKSLGHGDSHIFQNLIESSTKEKGHWPRSQTLVIEKYFGNE